MAQANNSLKRYLPLALIAVAVAESARAPLVNGSLSAAKHISSAKPALATAHEPSDANKKAPITWTAPAVAGSPDSSTIKRKLAEFEVGEFDEPFKTIVSSKPTTFSNPTTTDPIDLLPGTGLQNPGPGGNQLPVAFQPVYPAQGIGAGAGGTIDSPINPAGPTDQPASPAVGDAGLPTTSVPEPAALSMLAYAFGLLVRPKHIKRAGRNTDTSQRHIGPPILSEL